MERCSLPQQRMDGDFAFGKDGKFQGSFSQFQAMIAAVGVRNSIEYIHRGYWAGPQAPVVWPGGECCYGETARISREWFEGFKKSVHRNIELDMVRFGVGFKRMSETDAIELERRYYCIGKWFRPVGTEEEIQRFLPIAERAVFRKSGAKRGPGERTRMALEMDGFFEEFFKNAVAGRQEAALAAEAGEEVMVKTENGWEVWEDVNHFENTEMMAFNISLSDRLYQLSLAIDRARNWEDSGTYISL